MPLYGHHMKSYLGIEIEINGREFPDGPMDHALAFGVLVVAVPVLFYGAYAIVRDLWRWRRRRGELRVTGRPT